MKILYIIIAVVIAGVAVWYFFMMPQTPAPIPSALQENTPQNSIPPISSGNKTSDINSDFNQIPDDSAALTQDFNSLDQALKGF